MVSLCQQILPQVDYTTRSFIISRRIFVEMRVKEPDVSLDPIQIEELKQLIFFAEEKAKPGCEEASGVERCLMKEAALDVVHTVN